MIMVPPSSGGVFSYRPVLVYDLRRADGRPRTRSHRRPSGASRAYTRAFNYYRDAQDRNTAKRIRRARSAAHRARDVARAEGLNCDAADRVGVATFLAVLTVETKLAFHNLESEPK